MIRLKLGILVAMSWLISCGDNRPDFCKIIDFGQIYSQKSFENVAPPKIVWTFWDKGEWNMPGFHKFNVNNWRLKLEPLGYRVIVTNLVKGDPNNIRTILGGDDLLPEFLESFKDRAFLPNKRRMSVPVIQSDFIRLALLEKFGGIWMDGTDVLIKDISDLVTPEFIKSPQSMAGYSMEAYASSGSKVINGTPVDGFENWLIIAKEHSPIIKAWRKALIAYWRDKPRYEPIGVNPMFFCKGFDFGGLGESDYLNSHVALKYVLFWKPSLGNEIFPLNFDPWWIQNKSGGLNAEEHRFYETVVGPEKESLASKAMAEGLVLLKFASSHIPTISRNFPKPEDFCTTKNFFSLVYSLSMKSRSWCEVRKNK